MSEPRESHRVLIRNTSTLCALLAAWWLMMWLAYPKTNLCVLAHFALVPLTLVAIRGQSIKRVALLSYLAGVLWWAASVWWIGPVTLPGYIGLCFYMGLFPLGYVVCLRLIHERLRYPLVITVPIVWVAMEFLRGWIMTGFPWFMLGHSQPTWVIQVADLFGAYGVSFLVAMSSGMICDVLTRPLVRPRGSGSQRWGIPVRFSLPVWAAALVGATAYGAWRVGQFQATTPDSIRVAVVQTNVPQSNKTDPTEEQDVANYARMIELTEQAATAESKPDLIVWPETMAPRAINDESLAFFARLRPEIAQRYLGYRHRLERLASERDVALIVGAHAMLDWHETEGGAWRPRHRFNSAYLIEPDGSINRYDKLHRVPFGEYIPLVDTVPWLKSIALKLTPYEHDYTLRPGARIVRFELDVPNEQADAAVDTWRIATPICFEDVVSYLPRKMVWDGDAKRVDLLVNLSNDGWFVGSGEGPQHEQIARFRCVETRTPMARAVNTGVSGFIDSCGRVVRRVEVDGRAQNVDGTAAAQLYRDGRIPLFLRIGDVLAIGCAVVTAALIGLILLNRLLLGRAKPEE